MTSMSFDDFVTHVFNAGGLGPATIAYRSTVQVLVPTGSERTTVDEPVWRFAERDASGQWDIDRYRTEDLYLMARWVTSGWGRNTTGEGRLQTEPAKDVLTLMCRMLEAVCPTVTWTQSGKLFQAITSGTLAEPGTYEETTGDGVLEEYEFTYAYVAVKVRSLYQWLVDNGLLAVEH
jgi:hypothetical protein